MKRFLSFCFLSMCLACSSPQSGGSSADDGTDGTTTVDGTDGTDGSEDGSDGTDGTSTDGTDGVDGEDNSDKPAKWTMVTNTPDDVKQSVMRDFGGYIDESGANPYVCGDGGIFRILSAGQWQNKDLTTSDRINGCHIASNVMAAVGEQGKVWKWAGTENWQSFDLILEAPGLRDVWVSNLNILTVVGVQGAIYRLNLTEWTDQKLADFDGTLEAIWGPEGSNLLFAAGKDALLSFDGTEWKQEELPADPPGTPKANQGFAAKAIGGVGADHVWAVGEKGKAAYRTADGKWTYQDTNWYVLPFNAVFALSPTDVIIAGEKGKTRRYLGKEPWEVLEVRTPKKTKLGDTWPANQVVPAEESMNYIGVWATDPNHIWLMDRSGRLVQYNNEYKL